MGDYIEIIVQYHGNLQQILKNRGMHADIISEKYAIIKVHQSQIPYLQSQIQIEHLEFSQRVFETQIDLDSTTIASYTKQMANISGEGVVVGWIGNRLEINCNNFTKQDGTTRIIAMYSSDYEYNKNESNPIDIAIGNNGIASSSEIIFVNLCKEEIYTTDLIRAVSFIISKVKHTQKPTVIYLPFDIKKHMGRNNTLIQKILNDITLYGNLIVVNSIEQWNKNLYLNRAHIPSTCAPLTVGIISLLMEWAIIKGNNPCLCGERLKAYYIKKTHPLLKKQSCYTRYYRGIGVDDFLKLLLPMYPNEAFRTLDIAYEFVSDDAVIDVMMICSNPNIHQAIINTENIKIYPLVFPYFGLRGVVREIKKICNEVIGTSATGYLANILGNEPLNIIAKDFQAVSIIKEPSSYKGNNTLIGIIDTGIDYTNPVFIDSNGETRIVSIWDQTIGSESPYGYGTIYDKEMINRALKSVDPFSIVPHKDEWAIGTMLAGIAAGYGIYKEGIYEGVAPKAEIAVVKLKPANNDMQQIFHSNYNPLGFSTLDISLAVQYLVNLAVSFNKPISICLPAGTNSGSHDGTSVLDGVLRAYGQNQGISIILSAGDEANKAHHASGNLRDKLEQEVILNIPKGQGGFILEIWARFGDQLEVYLTPPQIGVAVPPTILLNKSQTYPLGNDSSVWSQGSTIDKDTGCRVIRFRLNNPTPGKWIVTVRGVIVVDGRYNLWIPKTGMIKAETILSPADPFTTIYNSASTVGIITVGCYDKTAIASYPSSGRGFTRDDRVKPDFLVEGVNIPAPIPNNKFGVVTGTAPSSIIAGAVCTLLYEQQTIEGTELANTPVMKALLTQKLKRQSTVTYPNPSSGYGLLDINSIFI